jgi:hypothetical protein
MFDINYIHLYFHLFLITELIGKGTLTVVNLSLLLAEFKPHLVQGIKLKKPTSERYLLKDTLL